MYSVTTEFETREFGKGIDAAAYVGFDLRRRDSFTPRILQYSIDGKSYSAADMNYKKICMEFIRAHTKYSLYYHEFDIAKIKELIELELHCVYLEEGKPLINTSLIYDAKVVLNNLFIVLETTNSRIKRAFFNNIEKSLKTMAPHLKVAKNFTPIFNPLEAVINVRLFDTDFYVNTASDRYGECEYAHYIRGNVPYHRLLDLHEIEIPDLEEKDEYVKGDRVLYLHRNLKIVEIKAKLADGRYVGKDGEKIAEYDILGKYSGRVLPDLGYLTRINFSGEKHKNENSNVECERIESVC